MGQIGLVFVGLLATAFGKPGIFSGPLTIATLTPGASVGPDGRVLDTPEVAAAKAEHAAAHANERLKLVDEASRSSAVQLQAIAGQPSFLISAAPLLVPGAPIGADGRVVDTPEVSVAKAAHAAAQINERINLNVEAARSAEPQNGQAILPVLSTVSPGAVIGPDGRILDTPEVAAAKAAHAAAQINERINLANEAARSGSLIAAGQAVPLLGGNGVIATLAPPAPIGLDGRVQDTAEVAVAKAAHAAAHINEKLNLANEAVKSAETIAVAGPALAYGRVVY